MRSYRSILAVLLAMVMAFLVSCAGPAAKAPPTYSAEQMEQIQNVASKVAALRDKMPVLADKIQAQNWTDVGTYIHGPLGDLRRNVRYLTRELLPQDQKQASEIADNLFSRLETIDIASSKGNYQVAAQNYRAALKDLDDFLRAIPQGNSAAKA